MARKKKDDSSKSESTPASAVVESTPAPSEPPSSAKMKPAKKKPVRPKGRKSVTKKPSKSAKAPMRYDAATKSKILAAAKGKKLSAAHAAAIGVGYRGTPASLYQMLRNAGVTRKKRRGRPAGSKNAVSTIRRGPGRPKSAAQLDGLGEIDQIVSRLVQGRVNAAARAAIAELEKLIK